MTIPNKEYQELLGKLSTQTFGQSKMKEAAETVKFMELYPEQLDNSHLNEMFEAIGDKQGEAQETIAKAYMANNHNQIDFETYQILKGFYSIKHGLVLDLLEKNQITHEEFYNIFEEAGKYRSWYANNFFAENEFTKKDLHVLQEIEKNMPDNKKVFPPDASKIIETILVRQKTLERKNESLKQENYELKKEVRELQDELNPDTLRELRSDSGSDYETNSIPSSPAPDPSPQIPFKSPVPPLTLPPISHVRKSGRSS